MQKSAHLTRPRRLGCSATGVGWGSSLLLRGLVLSLVAVETFAPGSAVAGDAPSSAPDSPPAAAPDPAGPAAPEPPPPPPPLWEPRRYGDRGTPELALGLGYGSSTGFLAAGGFRYFVVDALAPGIEATYVSGGAGGTAYGLVLGALRFVPFRTTSMALVATGRGGRMFVAHHDDGWAVGGGLGVLLMMSPSVGLEIGYEALRLVPATFCADLGTCTLNGITVGVRIIP